MWILGIKIRGVIKDGVKIKNPTLIRNGGLFYLISDTPNGILPISE